MEGESLAAALNEIKARDPTRRRPTATCEFFKYIFFMIFQK
jgi:hypothetical protein